MRLLLSENIIFITALRDGHFAVKSDKDLDLVFKQVQNKVMININDGYYFPKYITNENGK